MISVVIGTHNRADILKIALESLSQQDLPSEQYEVIVVDNASSDHTAEVAELYSTGVMKVRYIFEPQAGASIARNRGVEAALGDYIGFCDDDCKLPPDWLSKAQAIIDEHAPALFGGPYIPFYITPKPHWFKDAYGSSQSTSKADKIMHFDQTMKASRYISSGNMFVRRSLSAEERLFDPDYGPVAGVMAYAEDTAFVYEFQRTHPQMAILYDPDLFVYHLVRPNKMHVWWKLQAQYRWGRDMGKMYILSADERPSWLLFVIKRIGQIARILPGIVFDPLYGLLFRDRQIYPHIQNYLYEHTAEYFAQLGNWIAQFQYRNHPE